MFLFLINTPSQAINAAVMASTIFSDKKCDAYYTKNISKEMDVFANNHVFASTYQVELIQDIIERSNIFSRCIVRIKNALDLKLIEQNIPTSPMQYERVFASGVSLRNFEIYYAIKKNNDAVRFSLYEEGICEYYSLGAKKNWSKILFSLFFFHRYYLYDCDTLYVYNPNAVKNIWNNVTVKKIPKFSNDDTLVRIINKAVGYEKTQMEQIRNKFVVIEQAFATKQEELKQRELIDLLVNKVGKDRVVIKMHPRSSLEKYGSSLQVIDTNIPFEIIGLNENIESNIYVSVVSSVVLNFKHILNKEPDVIMLYKLMQEKTHRTSESGLLFERVQRCYKERAFLIPSTMDEYLQYVEQFNREMDR